ncbi:MAG: hypothetical protein ABEK50_19105 [bacterium]
MLDTGRDRLFFTGPPEKILTDVEEFCELKGAQIQQGTSALRIFRFEPDMKGSPRFLSVAVREQNRSPGPPVTGNVTFRWKEEPGGDYEQLMNDLKSKLNKSYDLYSFPEALQLTNDS